MNLSISYYYSIDFFICLLYNIIVIKVYFLIPYTLPSNLEWFDVHIYNQTTRRISMKRGNKKDERYYTITCWYDNPSDDHVPLGEILTPSMICNIIMAIAFIGVIAGCLLMGLLQCGHIQELNEFFKGYEDTLKQATLVSSVIFLVCLRTSFFLKE